jgi:hypothetical protein
MGLGHEAGSLRDGWLSLACWLARLEECSHVAGMISILGFLQKRIRLEIGADRGKWL